MFTFGVFGVSHDSPKAQTWTFEGPGAGDGKERNFGRSGGGLLFAQKRSKSHALWRSWTCKIRSYNTLCFTVVARS